MLRGISGRLVALVAAALVAVAVGACGSSGGSGSNAQSVLKQTFAGGHAVHSGVLDFALSVRPVGSSTLSTPIVLSINGPFQSRGTGKLPESALTLGVSALGHKGSLGVISTGSAGYVTLQGANYQLPQADFQKLEQSFSSSSASGSTPGLASFGIQPMHWLTHPSIVGTQTVGGASTTHIRAGVNVPALLADLNTFLSKTAKKTSSAQIPTQIPAATAQKIQAAVRNATVDLWTGKSDKTLRKLALNLSVPVTGQVSTELGGMTSAGIGLSFQYGQLNQTQSIAAPTNLQPYSQFTAKLQSLGQALSGALSSSTAGSGTGQSSGSGTATTGSSAGVSKYSQCIQNANGDVTKMQTCASLLNSGG